MANASPLKPFSPLGMNMNNVQSKTFFSLTAACLLAGIEIAQAGTREGIAIPAPAPIVTRKCDFAGPGFGGYDRWKCTVCEESEALQMSICTTSIVMAKFDPSDP